MLDPNFKKPKSDYEIDRECEQMTVETFERVVNEPATAEELSMTQLINAVVNHKQANLLLKGILNRMISIDWESTQHAINQAAFNHQSVEDATLLDMKVRD